MAVVIRISNEGNITDSSEDRAGVREKIKENLNFTVQQIL